MKTGITEIFLKMLNVLYETEIKSKHQRVSLSVILMNK